ncbi:MAG: type VI secretion system ATPase TssH, partial [Acidimicrobiales bacterium]|nr:type VI secretion system ATPase TssH [Acidimicrobiales bacterium]
EFINRIDEIIRFRPLTEADLRHIVDIQLEGLEARLAARRIELLVDPPARDWLAHRGYDPAFGARPLKRVIQAELGDALAKDLLEGRHSDGDSIKVTLAGDGLALE